MMQLNVKNAKEKGELQEELIQEEDTIICLPRPVLDARGKAKLQAKSAMCAESR